MEFNFGSKNTGKKPDPPKPDTPSKLTDITEDLSEADCRRALNLLARSCQLILLAVGCVNELIGDEKLRNLVVKNNLGKDS